jgi:uroporphyrinogen-III decarboxylase
MTVDEYVKKIASELFSNPQAYKKILDKATSVIEKSNIKQSSKDAFWIKLYNELGGKSNLCMDSQDSGKLWDLISAAKATIAAKTQKGK